MKLSIVTTMYFSEPYLDEFYSRCMAKAEKLTNDIEMIFVNDGSPDNSLEKAIELHQKDPRVIVIDLSRNFGHHKAMMAGLANSSGDYIFLIDSDLEEQPEFLGSLFDTLMKNKSCDVVYGIQEERKGGWFEKISGELLYRLVNRLSGSDMPRNIMVSRLMTRRYVDSLVEFRESELFIAGLWYITGYEQIGIIGKKSDKGTSTYDLTKKLKLTINSITSFSNKPLYYIFLTGLLISAMSLIYMIYLLINRIIFYRPIPGWTSIVLSIWLLGGIIILFLGIIGIYLSVIFIETKQRPYTIVRKIWN